MMAFLFADFGSSGGAGDHLKHNLYLIKTPLLPGKKQTCIDKTPPSRYA